MSSCTTGGTGVTDRDLTPEATAPSDARMDAIAMQIAQSAWSTPLLLHFAALSGVSQGETRALS